MTWDSPVTEIKGVGEEIARKLSGLGVKTISDLIKFYPRRYEDYSHITPIARIKPGSVTIKARIKQTNSRYMRRGLHLTEAAASDDSGSVRLIWFNQPYRATSLSSNNEYYISGEFSLSHGRLSIQNPSIELVGNFTVNTARIIPIYRETKGLKSSQIRKIMRALLTFIRDFPETLPPWLVNNQKLIPRSEALEMLHFPANSKRLAMAKQRLGFEEVFELTLAALLNKYEMSNDRAISITFDEKLARNFVSHLPFELTNAQRRSVWQIYQDMQKTTPMNRLLEGDVGSGKTVVAAMAAVMVLQQGFQAAMMAPTELLARQHADTIYNLLKPLNLQNFVGLLIGSLSSAKKSAAHTNIKIGNIRFIIGTHALTQEKVNVQNLGLIIVDEQHRFGVVQRKKLQAKAGHMPHVLHMTATPIPRSLALTLYGELDISIIETKPSNRLPIITEICSPNSRKQLYDKIDLELAAGRQMFVVTPLINESVSLKLKSAEQVYEILRKGPFKHRRVGLLHGKMKASQKELMMRQFVGHELDILVATTVIEVGVDVPNATVILIENAERFGLAQLHQLRGRVGRSLHQGYAYLMLGDSAAPSRRLRALESSSDGFKLAELDLEMRGPGAIYGTQQHGALDLRLAKITDTKLIATARKSAQDFIDRDENLLQYEYLYHRVNQLRSVTNLN